MCNYTITTKSFREFKVQRLYEQFLERGVNKYTAKAWAEAEIPEEVIYIYTTTSSSNQREFL